MSGLGSWTPCLFILYVATCGIYEEEIEASQKPIKSLKTTQKIVGE